MITYFLCSTFGKRERFYNFNFLFLVFKKEKMGLIMGGLERGGIIIGAFMNEVKNYDTRHQISAVALDKIKLRLKAKSRLDHGKPRNMLQSS